MRINKNCIFAITLTFIFILVGFFLPEWIVTHTDQSMMEKVGFETIEPQKIISDNETSMVEKIGLLRDYPQNVNRITLEMSTNFDWTSANAKFLEEILVLTKLGFLPEIETDDKTAVKIDVSLYAQKDDPSTSGVFWNIILRKDKFLGSFFMDDNTGKIMQFIVTTEDHLLSVENKSIEAWANYLGLEAQHINSQPKKESIWEDENVKIYDDGYTVYNFELGSEDNFLPYAFYTFKNGYGFGNIMEFKYLNLE